MGCSTGLIFFNAGILTQFPHPFSLTCWHMLNASILVHALKCWGPSALFGGKTNAAGGGQAEEITMRLILVRGVPIAISQVVSLAAGNGTQENMKLGGASIEGDRS